MLMEEEEKTTLPRGFLPGNQYARTHGFYSKILDEMEQLDYQHAVEVEGLDAEIAMMRVKIKSVMEKDPENLKLINQAMNILTRLVIAKYNISKDDKPGIEETIGNVFKEVAVSWGARILGSYFKR
jgi:hypothetical protein